MPTMETRGEKIEEFHKHLKYREHIIEFTGPKRNVAEDEPPTQAANLRSPTWRRSTDGWKR